jgi:ubiquitin-protein ligase
MLTDKGVKRVMKEIKEMKERPPSDKSFTISFQESNLQVFFAIIRSLDGDYEGGEYILRIALPYNYPFSPPVISCQTPNGRFIPGTNICLNISHFHSESWSALITLEKIILSVMSVFYDEKINGVGSISSPPNVKRTLARNSKAYNQTHFSEVLRNEVQ